MLTIGNDAVAVAVSADGLRVEIHDVSRGMVWRLDPRRWGYSSEPMGEAFSSPVDYRFTPFLSGVARRVDARRMEVRHPLPDGWAEYEWSLLPDGVEVRLRVVSASAQRVSVPGSFRPTEGGLDMLIPHQQGMLLRDTGPARHHRYTMDRFSMLSMLGYLGPRAGLLACQEDIRDRFLDCGRDQGGVYGFFDATPCAVEGWYERAVRLYPTDASITAVCKRYRARLIERGMFEPWSRKIAIKPIVKKLFGSLLAFIGYNQGRRTDYVAGARRLRAMGFESVFYYPVRFNLMMPGVKMGGDEPLHLSEAQLDAIEAAGGTVAPWTYTYDALDSRDPAMLAAYATDRDGRRRLGWKMDGNEFYRVCTGHQIDFVRRRYQDEMRRMGWNHYDVTAIVGGMPCFNAAHTIHAGRALTARQDQELVGRLLGPEINGNRVVSSEGFNEFAARFYDIGSNKTPPCWGDQQYTPVPMTMLVLHDSAIHNWWEIHVYNDLSAHYSGKRREEHGGSGQSAKRAAMDALYGCPPLVFPFGRQYGWVKDVWGPTFSYEVDIDEPAVQQALAAALPVTRLHRRIGMCEMTGFELVTPDAAVQSSTFSDGTRIVANISDEPRNTQAFGEIGANTWKEVRA